jgi:hypothetical protein
MTEHDRWLESPYTDAEDGIECDDCDACQDADNFCTNHEEEDADSDEEFGKELAHESWLEDRR